MQYRVDDKNKMITVHTECFNLQQIMDSGQCFRISCTEPDCYQVLAGSRVVQVHKQGDGWSFFCSREEFESFWKHYFDLETDYNSYGRAIDEKDRYLKAAFAYGCGIRILNQDPWEMLITFILSQRKNIPAIRQAVEALCRFCGSPLDNGGELYAFPSPVQLAALSLEQLKGLSLGYRAKYVCETARRVANGELALEQWAQLSDDELRKNLLSCYGVGIKVANCVALFGYHRTSAFPVDVWIDRIQQRFYGGRFPAEQYPGFAGVLQQYMFYYERNHRE